MGISLWIVPPDNNPVSSELKQLITTLSEKHHSPNFHPHITLASLPRCVSLEEIITCLNAHVKPITISFRGVRTGRTYFQSVFVAIEATQSILDLHEHVHGTLGIQPKTPEFPHLSLYYGDENKEEIAQTAGELLSSAGDEFMAAEIWIVNCEGKPESWSTLEKVQLPLQ